MTCELCSNPGGELLWQDERCRVVLIGERGYEGFCRVIWAAHVKEMTDLPKADREHLMRVVFAVEAAVRACTGCHKVNLASFGNYVPHVHWHVIPRFSDDRHFPDAFWSPAVREDAPGRAHATPDLQQRLGGHIASTLNQHM
jgi:diadenosine tetraphosphate (Ap4A) HIT family hydrolase